MRVCKVVAETEFETGLYRRTLHPKPCTGTVMGSGLGSKAHSVKALV